MSDYHHRAKVLRARLADLKAASPIAALPQALSLADDLTGFLVEVLDRAENLAALLDQEDAA